MTSSPMRRAFPQPLEPDLRTQKIHHGIKLLEVAIAIQNVALVATNG